MTWTSTPQPGALSACRNARVRLEQHARTVSGSRWLAWNRCLRASPSAAISATLALALLSKVLQVTRKRKDFAGDSDLISSLMNDTQKTSEALSCLADEDVAAYHEYLECLRQKQPTGDAIRKTIEVPLDVAAHCFARHRALRKGRGPRSSRCRTPTWAIAAGLLAGVVRSTLVTVNSNIQQLSEDDPYRARSIRRGASAGHIKRPDEGFPIRRDWSEIENSYAAFAAVPCGSMTNFFATPLSKS